MPLSGAWEQIQSAARTPERSGAVLALDVAAGQRTGASDQRFHDSLFAGVGSVSGSAEEAEAAHRGTNLLGEERIDLVDGKPPMQARRPPASTPGRTVPIDPRTRRTLPRRPSPRDRDGCGVLDAGRGADRSST